MFSQEALAGEEIVDAPANVALTGAAAVRPPRVLLVGRMKSAPGVDETVAYVVGHSLSTLIGESGVASVGVGASEVDFFMGDVEVAAYEDGFLLVQGFEVGEKGFIPDELAVFEATEVIFFVGNIDVDEEELRIFGSHDAPFFARVAELVLP